MVVGIVVVFPWFMVCMKMVHGCRYLHGLWL